jgi:hypothetical protein
MVNVPPHEQSKSFMKNSKKFYKHPNKPGRHYFPPSDLTADHTTHTGENSAPAIAVVAPTARNPSHTHAIHATCKATSQMSTAPRTMHVQHHIHHIQPMQISTTLSPPPGSAPTNANPLTAPPPNVTNWPVVEPAFHFGPGFEIHQTYCPTHSANDQHLVFFHIMPGIAVSFAIAGGHKIIQGECFFTFISYFSRKTGLFCVCKMCNTENRR